MTPRDLFSSDDAETQVLTVSELTAQIKDLLEVSYPSVWVTGEISNFARPRSGHCYLTIKDEDLWLRIREQAND